MGETLSHGFEYITAPAHLAPDLLGYSDTPPDPDEWAAVCALLEGFEVLDVRRDEEGNALEPWFTWHYRLHGGTARGGTVTDYLCRAKGTRA